MNKILEDFTEEKRGTMCYNCRNVFCETCVRGLALEALEDYKQEIREKIEGMKRDVPGKCKEYSSSLDERIHFDDGYSQALQDVLDKLK